MFSSGPLDTSADTTDIPPAPVVGVFAERVGAIGHATFGGRLEPAATGFPAHAMAKTHSGDWRNADRIQAWAAGIGAALPGARPGQAIERPAHSLRCLLSRAVTGWAVCAALTVLLLTTMPLAWALTVHAIGAPLIFTMIARAYFRNRGARAPLPTAIAWTSIVIALDAIVIAGVVQRRAAMFTSIAGTWLPVLLIFVVVWATGAIMSMLPLPRSATA